MLRQAISLLGSLLSASKKLIAVRKSTTAFGRGSMSFIRPENRSVLAYVRQYRDEAILCVANLSRSAQAAELDLSPWKDRVPLEMLGRTRFPAVGSQPYLLTLGSHAFYWFSLEPQRAGAGRGERETAPALLALPPRWGDILGAAGREALEEILPTYLQRCYWCWGTERTADQVGTAHGSN